MDDHAHVTIKIMRLVVGILALSVITAGCTPADSQTEVGATAAAARECLAAPGSPLDVAGEPDWRQYSRYSLWTDVSGCIVRIDVLAERPGPDHCGWERSRVMITGDPLGARQQDAASAIHYVKDPEGVYGVTEFVDEFMNLEVLPSDAVDTGFRQGERELWTSPSDPEAVLIRTLGSVERWPRGDPPGCM